MMFVVLATNLSACFGGEIDTVELHNGGTIQWIFLKAGRPEKKD